MAASVACAPEGYDMQHAVGTCGQARRAQAGVCQA